MVKTQKHPASDAPQAAPDSVEARLEHAQAQLDITNNLLGAVSSLDPVRTLTTRIGVICHGTAIIYDFEGNVISSTGEAPAQLIWNEVSSTNQQDLALEIGRWHVRTRRVSLRDGVHVLAIASRGHHTLDEIGEVLLDTAERLLGAVYGIQHGASLRDRRDNEQLLAALHDGILPAREHRFWARLGTFRFPAYTQLRILECSPIDEASATEASATALLTKARAEGVPLLIMLRRVDVDAPATVSALVQDTPASEQWIDSFDGKMLVGVSAPFSALAEVPASVHEAETALGIARSRAGAHPGAARHKPVRMDRIDLTSWALSHVDQRALQEHIAETLAPLRQTALLDTLITYLASEQNIALAAETLFVHPNTVRYRLSRIEQIIGAPINSTPAIANLVLALHPQVLGRSEELRELQQH